VSRLVLTDSIPGSWFARTFAPGVMFTPPARVPALEQDPHRTPVYHLDVSGTDLIMLLNILAFPERVTSYAADDENIPVLQYYGLMPAGTKRKAKEAADGDKAAKVAREDIDPAIIALYNEVVYHFRHARQRTATVRFIDTHDVGVEGDRSTKLEVAAGHAVIPVVRTFFPGGTVSSVVRAFFKKKKLVVCEPTLEWPRDPMITDTRYVDELLTGAAYVLRMDAHDVYSVTFHKV
jgi:hypothetical protein